MHQLTICSELTDRLPFFHQLKSIEFQLSAQPVCLQTHESDRQIQGLVLYRSYIFHGWGYANKQAKGLSQYMLYVSSHWLMEWEIDFSQAGRCLCVVLKRLNTTHKQERFTKH